MQHCVPRLVGGLMRQPVIKRGMIPERGSLVDGIGSEDKQAGSGDMNPLTRPSKPRHEREEPLQSSAPHSALIN